MTQLWSIIVITFACFIGSYGAILLKKGADTLKFKFKALITNKYLIGGVLIYGVSTIFYIIALRGGELSILYPLVSTTYVWIAIFSQKFLNEKMNKFKWLGILLILMGVSLIGIGS